MKTYLWILHVFGIAFSFLFGFDQDRGTWVVAILFGFLSILALWGLITLHLKEAYER